MKKTLIAVALIAGLFTASAQQPDNGKVNVPEKIENGKRFKAAKSTELASKVVSDEVLDQKTIAEQALDKNGRPIRHHGKKHHGKKHDRCYRDREYCDGQQYCDRIEDNCTRERRYCDPNGRKQKRNPFAGITLTDAQKDKIKAIKEKQKKEADKRRDAAEKSRKKSRENYMKELQKILTPEQFAQFKANTDTMKRISVSDKKSKGFLIPGEQVKAPLPPMDYQKK